MHNRSERINGTNQEDSNYDYLSPVYAGIQIFLSFCIITGNVLVMSVVYKFKSLRVITSIFIVSLAAADFLVGLTIPYYVLFYFNLSFTHIKSACLFRYFIILSSTCTSSLTLVAAAVDRYVAVLHPLTYPRIMSSHYVFIIVASIWIYIIILCCLPFWGINTWRKDVYCDLAFIVPPGYGITFVAVHSAIALIVTSVLYARIFHEAWKQKRQIDSFENGRKSFKLEARLTGMMALVFGVSYITFAPYIIVISIRYFIKHHDRELETAKKITTCLYFARSAINPVIYAWKNLNIRTAFIKILFKYRNQSHQKDSISSKDIHLQT